MNPLIPTPTQFEADRNTVVLPAVIRSATALHHLAVEMMAANRQFWSLPTERLLDQLNADVPWTLSVFAANTATAEAVNAQLDQFANLTTPEGLPMFPARAPTTLGRSDIVFDEEAGEFVHVAAEEPEPE